MESPFVRAKEAFAVEWQGFTQVFNVERLFEKKHPLVQAYPERFEPAVPLDQDRVEQATAEPGEKRNR